MNLGGLFQPGPVKEEAGSPDCFMDDLQAVQQPAGHAQGGSSLGGSRASESDDDVVMIAALAPHAHAACGASFLLADGSPLPPDVGISTDDSMVYRRGSNDSETTTTHEDVHHRRPQAREFDDDAVAASTAKTARRRRADNNRRAQQRWRDRQKERSQQVAAQIAGLQKQLEEVSLAKEVLAARNATLEQLLALRQAAANQKSVYETLLIRRPATPQEQRQQLACNRPRMAVEQQETAWWLDPHTKAQLAAELGIDGEMVFTASRSAPLFATAAQIAAMPVEDWAQTFQDLLAASAICLMQLQAGDASGAAAARLERLTDECIKMKLCVGLEHPNQDFALDQRITDVTERGAGETLHSMRCKVASYENRAQIVEGMRLTGEQSQAIIALRHQYLSNVAALIRRRDQLEKVLQQGPVNSTECCGGFDQLQRAIAGIGETLCLEHSNLLGTFAAVWAVFTPAQLAHLNLTVAPVHPNALCVAEMVAMMAGVPPSGALFQQLRSQGTPTDQLVPINSGGKALQPAPPADLAALYPHLTTPAAMASALRATLESAAAAMDAAAAAPQSHA